MADIPHVDYDWDFEGSPMREGFDDDGDEEDETVPRERDWWEEGDDEEDDDEFPVWGRPAKRARFVRCAAGPLDTLDG